MFQLLFDFIVEYYHLLKEFYLDNPLFKISLAFVPAILGIAYPLLIQTISRLDNQYKSTHIIDRFKLEKIHIFFIWSLRISTFLVILTFIGSWLIFTLAFLSTILLLFAFFFYVKLLIVFLSGKELFDHFLKITKIKGLSNESLYIKSEIINSQKELILSTWRPVIDLLHYAIRNQNKVLENDIYELYIYPCFKFIYFIDNKDSLIVKFPIELYNSMYELIVSYIRSNDKYHYSRIPTLAGSIFYEYYSDENKFIHPDTYYAIWTNLTLLIEDNRCNDIKDYWAIAHQSIGSIFRRSDTIFDEDFNETRESKEAISQIEQQRKMYIQFHTVLCAYIMYKEKYKMLHSLWFHANSQPPNYSLIINSMSEIFNYYMDFSSIYFKDSKFTIRYWFKGISFDGYNNQIDVKFIVRKYLVLIFLKQWTDSPTYYGINPLKFPSLPIDQSKKKSFIEKLEGFKELVEKLLLDKNILKEFGLEKITEQWCKDKKKDYPTVFIDNLKKYANAEFDRIKMNEEIDEDKISKIKATSKDKIDKIYQDYRLISGIDVEKNDRDELSKSHEVIRGVTLLIDKEALIKNSSTTYLDIDSLFASGVMQNYTSHISLKFLANKTNTYKINSGSLYSAVDKLNLNSDEHIIVVFGRNLEMDIDHYKIDIQKKIEDLAYFYKDIPIFRYSSGYTSISNTFFILKRNDLPMIINKDWREVPDSAKDYWETMDPPISDESELYFRYRELIEGNEKYNEYLEKGKTKEEIHNQVEVILDLIGYCWFKKNTFMIQLKEAYKLQEGGDVDDIEKLKTFNELFEEHKTQIR